MYVCMFMYVCMCMCVYIYIYIYAPTLNTILNQSLDETSDGMSD